MLDNDVLLSEIISNKGHNKEFTLYNVEIFRILLSVCRLSLNCLYVYNFKAKIF